MTIITPALRTSLSMASLGKLEKQIVGGEHYEGVQNDIWHEDIKRHSRAENINED